MKESIAIVAAIIFVIWMIVDMHKDAIQGPEDGTYERHAMEARGK